MPAVRPFIRTPRITDMASEAKEYADEAEACLAMGGSLARALELASERIIRLERTAELRSTVGQCSDPETTTDRPTKTT